MKFSYRAIRDKLTLMNLDPNGILKRRHEFGEGEEGRLACLTKLVEQMAKDQGLTLASQASYRKAAKLVADQAPEDELECLRMVRDQFWKLARGR